MIELKKLFIYRKRLIKPYVDRGLKILDALCYTLSALFIIALVYEHGFRISPAEGEMIHRVYATTWFIFLLSSALHLTFAFGAQRRRYNPLTWGLTLLLYSTLLPHLFSGYLTGSMWVGLWRVLSSDIFETLLLTALSLLQLSMGVVRLLNRRVNPSGVLSASFFAFIIIGTAMLLLPRATYEGISIIDALFMSTSAICVTGLSTVDVAETFTPMGITFIMILIQIGGLGVMTLTSFFAMSFMGNSSLGNQLMVSNMISSKSLSSLFSTLLYILGFTFIIEVAGALLILFDIHGTMGMTLSEELFFALFHSISAFCNAGFSTLSGGLGEPILMGGHNIFYLVITALIILGGVGFPILVNLYQIVRYRAVDLYRRYVRGEARTRPMVHLYDLNTRIVVLMTMLLLSGATIAIAILEWNGGFAGMPVADKIVHSLFNAASPRTAGFSSISITSFSIQTLLLLAMLMVIGGGTQSTAGGIKVNVFAVILLNLRAILYGRERVTAFGRELSQSSIRRSNSTLVLYLMIIAISLFLLTIFESEASLLALTFEAISALSTVGTSLDLTPTLSGEGKFIIIVLMFVGRVGVLTMASSLIKQRRLIKERYPSGNIIIN